jgi:streptomycin 6-kinase
VTGTELATPVADGSGGVLLADRVRPRLAELHPGEQVGRLADLPGGHSGLTYAVPVGARRYVVKAVPPGQRPVGRNDVLRQAAVLRALRRSAVPVPRVVAVDGHAPAWFAMTYEPGEAVEPVLDDISLEPRLARDRMLRLAGVLRTLHDLEVATLDLPPQDPLGPGAELERWTRTMRAVPEELRPGSVELLRRLAERVPSPVSPALVHGDFRLGNVLCVGARPRAVVDWEIWSVGDRRTDLGWFLAFTDHAAFPGVGHPVPGLPSEHELLAAYAGESSPPPDMPWFRALGRMKMAAIMGHNLRRHREGKHHDPVQEQLPPTIAALIASARSILGLGV